MGLRQSREIWLGIYTELIAIMSEQQRRLGCLHAPHHSQVSVEVLWFSLIQSGDLVSLHVLEPRSSNDLGGRRDVSNSGH